MTYSDSSMLAIPIERALAAGLTEADGVVVTAGMLYGNSDLADLAQTIAALTGGLVTIEDMSARVLAYSRSSDEVDDLRRLSILGRSGPPAYLKLLREWGVYDRLAASEDVVEIDEHPESGVRRRLAVGVFAGERQIATIWVQQGHDEFPPHARQALLGAARVTAEQLTRPSGPSGQHDALREVLTGRTTPASLGKLAAKPHTYLAFAQADANDDRAATRLLLDDLTRIVRVHSAAFRRSALVTQLDDHVYGLLPNTEPDGKTLKAIDETVADAQRHLGSKVKAALAPDRESLDQTLELAEPGKAVAFASIRARLLIELVQKALLDKPYLRDEAVTTLDAELRDTLLTYLDTGSDVTRTAALMHLHPTTIRYRLRKALDMAGIDLGDPDERLASHLQLRADLDRFADR